MPSPPSAMDWKRFAGRDKREGRSCQRQRWKLSFPGRAGTTPPAATNPTPHPFDENDFAFAGPRQPHRPSACRRKRRQEAGPEIARRKEGRQKRGQRGRAQSFLGRGRRCQRRSRRVRLEGLSLQHRRRHLGQIRKNLQGHRSRFEQRRKTLPQRRQQGPQGQQRPQGDRI